MTRLHARVMTPSLANDAQIAALYHVRAGCVRLKPDWNDGYGAIVMAPLDLATTAKEPARFDARDCNY